MRRLTILFAALPLVIATAACGKDGGSGTSDTSPIKIGQIVSLTGNYAPLGSENKKSVELAVEQLNS